MKKILKISLNLTFFLIAFALIGCGSSDNEISFETLPKYPGAEKGEKMEKSLFGMVGGKMAAYSTTDGYYEVVQFYTDTLRHWEPELTSQESSLGEQTAFVLKKNKGLVSVAIQELDDEGKVNITFMSVSR